LRCDTNRLMIPMSGEQRDFNAAAATWDENPVRLKLAQDVFRALSDSGLIRPGMDVLEIGCGTGLVTLLLQPCVHSITAADSSAGMLDILKEKVRRINCPTVKPLLVNLEGEGGIGGRYDLVVSSMTFHHIRDVPALLGRIAAITKPGGILCIADLDREGGKFHEDNTGVFHYGFDRAVFRKQFGTAGFEMVRNRTAAIIRKPDSSGNLRCFTVFLMYGRIPDPAGANPGGA
jgi:ubiquinone/menaquinone biosynthesis C-methylase UbiE